jgi:hypothetical protein
MSDEHLNNLYCKYTRECGEVETLNGKIYVNKLQEYLKCIFFYETYIEFEQNYCCFQYEEIEHIIRNTLGFNNMDEYGHLYRKIVIKNEIIYQHLNWLIVNEIINNYRNNISYYYNEYKMEDYNG